VLATQKKVSRVPAVALSGDNLGQVVRRHGAKAKAGMPHLPVDLCDPIVSYEFL